MAIADGSTCHFTRVVGGGLEAMAVEIAERREMSLEQARALLADAAVDPTLQPARISTTAGSGAQ